MGAFVEEATTFEQVQRKMVQIYNDSTDLGYPYNSKNPNKDIKMLLDSIETFKNLDKKYPKEKSFIRNRNVWTNGVSIDVYIAWEENNGIRYGTKYHISFQKTPVHPALIKNEYDSFISVMSTSFREPSN